MVQNSLACQILAERRRYHAEQQAGLDKLSASLHLEGRIDLVQSLDPVAFCYGWLKPRICISAGILARLDSAGATGSATARAIPSAAPRPFEDRVSRVLTSAFFFLPLVRGLQQQYLVAKEIEADRHVIDSQGTDRPLLRALYKLLLKQSNPASTAPTYVQHGVAGATDALNQRLDYLLNGRAPVGLRRHSLFLSSIVLTGISYHARACNVDLSYKRDLASGAFGVWAAARLGIRQVVTADQAVVQHFSTSPLPHFPTSQPRYPALPAYTAYLLSFHLLSSANLLCYNRRCLDPCHTPLDRLWASGKVALQVASAERDSVTRPAAS